MIISVTMIIIFVASKRIKVHVDRDGKVWCEMEQRVWQVWCKQDQGWWQVWKVKGKGRRCEHWSWFDWVWRDGEEWVTDLGRWKYKQSEPTLTLQ